MREILEAYRIKRTNTRLIVTELIANEGDNTFTVADIAAELDETPIQTVYTIFRKFVDAGIIERCPTIDNTMMFRSTEAFKKDLDTCLSRHLTA